jgi:hypothetical protein
MNMNRLARVVKFPLFILLTLLYSGLAYGKAEFSLRGGVLTTEYTTFGMGEFAVGMSFEKIPLALEISGIGVASQFQGNTYLEAVLPMAGIRLDLNITPVLTIFPVLAAGINPYYYNYSRVGKYLGFVGKAGGGALIHLSSDIALRGDLTYLHIENEWNSTLSFDPTGIYADVGFVNASGGLQLSF